MNLEEIGGWPGVLSRLLAGRSLDARESAAALGDVLSGIATEAQIAAFAMALRTKGETVEEMVGFVQAMRQHGVPVESEDPSALVDTCGTGGDRSGTINVSTIAAFIVAGAGAPVCKHGGRASSSKSGSADVLEALGVTVDLGPEGVARCITATGMGFCLATRYHPAMRHAAPVRRELGVPTVFNFLGPLSNPARAGRQVVGVGDPAMAERMLAVLEENGARHAVVCFGHDGLDELSVASTSTLLESVLEPDGSRRRRQLTVDPQALGLAPASPEALLGGDAACNADAVRRVIGGDRGPQRDFAVLNAAAGLMVAGLAQDLGAGVAVAAEVLDRGAAQEVFERLLKLSNELAAERPR